MLSFLADAQPDLDFILLLMMVQKFGMLYPMTSVYVKTIPSSKNYYSHGLVPPATVQYVVPLNSILQILCMFLQLPVFTLVFILSIFYF